MSRRNLKLQQKVKFSGTPLIKKDERTISFSLAYMTRNKHFTFDYFGTSRARDELAARKSLDDLLTELSVSSWTKALQKRKSGFGGVETINFGAVRFTPCGFSPSEGTKYLSFRFGAQQYRMLGQNINGILYIYGFDFDHSAYNHGS